MTRLYAKAVDTPEAPFLRVIDDATGAELRDVIEVDATNGWLVRAALDRDGKLIVDGDEIVTERVEGLKLRIEIDDGWHRGGDKGKYRPWIPDETADGITELHKFSRR